MTLSTEVGLVGTCSSVVRRLIMTPARRRSSTARRSGPATPGARERSYRRKFRKTSVAHEIKWAVRCVPVFVPTVDSASALIAHSDLLPVASRSRSRKPCSGGITYGDSVRSDRAIWLCVAASSPSSPSGRNRKEDGERMIRLLDLSQLVNFCSCSSLRASRDLPTRCGFPLSAVEPMSPVPPSRAGGRAAAGMS